MKTVIAIVAAATIAALTLTGVVASAASKPLTRQQQCAAQGRSQTVHRVADRALTWQLVTPDEVRYFKIGACSVIVTGNGHSVIINERGQVVVTS